MVRTTFLTAMSILLFGVIDLAAQRPDFAASRYFVGFNQDLTPSDSAFLRSQGVQLGRIFSKIKSIEIVVRNSFQLLAIQRNPRVEFVEAMPMRYATTLGTQQLVPNINNGLYGLVTTKAVNVHTLGHSGAGVKVGVADTGIDCAHPDIAPNLIDSEDFVGAGTHGGCWLPGELSELHATHVAGTIVGVFNSVGVYGVAHNASLYHARVLGPSGGTTAEVMAGVEWLAEQAGVRVINLSLGGGAPSIAEFRFYQQVRQGGVLVVAAAGNNGGNKISYPAHYPPNIAVGAVDSANAHATFSQTGLGMDVSAPGVNVLSSVPNGTGSEASVTTTSTFPAIGLEFAGKTAGAGLAGTLVNCGQAVIVTDCPPSVSGNIALIQRGTNSFAEKVANAMTAGAAAAILYNNVPGAFAGTLGTPTNNGQPWIPGVTVSDTDGATLVGQAGTSATVLNILSSWDFNSGTSMATPHVAGVLALMWGAAPNRSQNFIESVLFSTCVDLGSAGYDTTFGYGLVNALDAVQKAMATPDIPPAP